MTALNALWYLSVAGNVAVLSRLAGSRLIGRYPAFSGYLIASLARSLCLIVFAGNPAAPAYSALWLISEPLLCVLQILMAVEICHRVQAHYPGLGRIGRDVAKVALGASAAVCAVTLPLALTAPDWSQPAREILLLAMRCQSFVSCGMLLMTLVFYHWWWAPKRRNVVRHALLGAAFFAAEAVYYQGMLTHRENYFWLTCGVLAATSICFALWTALLSASGEELPKLAPIDPDRVRRIQREWEAVIETARLLNREQFRGKWRDRRVDETHDPAARAVDVRKNAGHS